MGEEDPGGFAGITDGFWGGTSGGQSGACVRDGAGELRAGPGPAPGADLC